MDFSRLGRGDIVAAAGGLLLLHQPVPAVVHAWSAPPQSENLCGAGKDVLHRLRDASLFLAIIPGMDFLLVGALAPWILVWIVVRGHELSWPPGEVTMIVGGSPRR